jgi:hypothetical protein
MVAIFPSFTPEGLYLPDTTPFWITIEKRSIVSPSYIYPVAPYIQLNVAYFRQYNATEGWV